MAAAGNYFGVDYQSPLIESIALGDIKDAINIIRTQQQLNLDKRDHSGRSPLDYCIPPAGKDYSSYNEDTTLEGDEKCEPDRYYKL